jgi:hypothetical protein
MEGGIILFCIWHMGAVAMTLLPEGTGLYSRVAARGQAISAPYILSLSQWQRWSIFAPDPLLRDSFFRIDQLRGESWESLVSLDYDHLPWTEREKELKILSNLESTWYGVVPYYLRGYCETLHLESGSVLRLVSRYHILPGELSHLSHMALLQLPTEEFVLGYNTCTTK